MNSARMDADRGITYLRLSAFAFIGAQLRICFMAFSAILGKCDFIEPQEPIFISPAIYRGVVKGDKR